MTKISEEQVRCRKEAILAAAKRVFARKGCAQATMHDVANEAGLSVGAIYLYYPGKDELMQRRLREHRRKHPGSLQQGGGGGHHSGEILRATGRVLEQRFQDPATRDETVLVLEAILADAREARSTGTGMESGPGSGRQLRGAYLMLTEWLFGRAQETGALDPRIDTEALAQFFVSLMVGIHVLSLEFESGLDVKPVLKRGRRDVAAPGSRRPGGLRRKRRRGRLRHRSAPRKVLDEASSDHRWHRRLSAPAIPGGWSVSGSCSWYWPPWRCPGCKGALSGDEMKFLSNPDSVQGQTLLGERMPGLSTSSGAMETILVHSDELTVDDPAFQQVVTQTAAAVAAEKELVAQAYDYYQILQFQPETAESLVSADRHTTLIPVSLAASAADTGDRHRGIHLAG